MATQGVGVHSISSVLARAKTGGYDGTDALYSLAFYHQHGFYVKRDMGKAEILFIHLAQKGELGAKGQCHVHGWGGHRKNENEARRCWVRGAMEKNDMYSTLLLALHYQTKEETKMKSVELFKRAAYRKCTQAKYWLGYFYATGYGVDTDLVKAVEYYKESAKEGWPVSMHSLAICYQHGRVGKVDVQEAIANFQRAADAGYPPSVKALEKLRIPYSPRALEEVDITTVVSPEAIAAAAPPSPIPIGSPNMPRAVQSPPSARRSTTLGVGDAEKNLHLANRSRTLNSVTAAQSPLSDSRTGGMAQGSPAGNRAHSFSTANPVQRPTAASHPADVPQTPPPRNRVHTIGAANVDQTPPAACRQADAAQTPPLTSPSQDIERARESVRKRKRESEQLDDLLASVQEKFKQAEKEREKLENENKELKEKLESAVSSWKDAEERLQAALSTEAETQKKLESALFISEVKNVASMAELKVLYNRAKELMAAIDERRDQLHEEAVAAARRGTRKK